MAKLFDDFLFEFAVWRAVGLRNRCPFYVVKAPIE
jgi:hypothetical protein